MPQRNHTSYKANEDSYSEYLEKQMKQHGFNNLDVEVI